MKTHQKHNLGPVFVHVYVAPLRRGTEARVHVFREYMICMHGTKTQRHPRIHTKFKQTHKRVHTRARSWHDVSIPGKHTALLNVSTHMALAHARKHCSVYRITAVQSWVYVCMRYKSTYTHTHKLSPQNLLWSCRHAKTCTETHQQKL